MWLFWLLLLLSLIALIGYGFLALIRWFFRLFFGKTLQEIKPMTTPKPEGINSSPASIREGMEEKLKRLLEEGLLEPNEVQRVFDALKELDFREKGEAWGSRGAVKPEEKIGVDPMAGTQESKPLPVPRATAKPVLPTWQDELEEARVEKTPPLPVCSASNEDESLEKGPGWTEILAAFMESRHIRWGEVIGGMLIVLCSTALVASFWSTIESVPWLKFGLFSGVTAAAFGAAWFLGRRWKLPTTAQVLTCVAHLLLPLNFLMMAAFRSGGPAEGLLLQIPALVALGWLSSRTAPILAGSHWKGLTCGTVATAGSILIIDRLVGSNSSLGIYAFGAAVVLAAWWMPGFLVGGWFRRLEQRWDGGEVLAVAGVGLFGLILSLTFLMTRHVDGIEMCRRLAPVFALAGLPLLRIGLSWRGREAAPHWSGIVFSSVAAFGAAWLLLAQGLAMHQPAVFVVLALLNAVLFALVAWWTRWSAVLYPAAGFAALGLAGLWLWVGGNLVAVTDSPLRLIGAFLSAPAMLAWSAALVVLGGACVGLWRKLKSSPGVWWNAVPLLHVCAFVAIIQVGLSIWHGWGREEDHGSFWILTADAMIVLVLALRTGWKPVGAAFAFLLVAACSQGLGTALPEEWRPTHLWDWTGLLSAAVLLGLVLWRGTSFTPGLPVQKNLFRVCAAGLLCAVSYLLLFSFSVVEPGPVALRLALLATGWFLLGVSLTSGICFVMAQAATLLALLHLAWLIGLPSVTLQSEWEYLSPRFWQLVAIAGFAFSLGWGAFLHWANRVWREELAQAAGKVRLDLLAGGGALLAITGVVLYLGVPEVLYHLDQDSWNGTGQTSFLDPWLWGALGAGLFSFGAWVRRGSSAGLSGLVVLAALLGFSIACGWPGTSGADVWLVRYLAVIFVGVAFGCGWMWRKPDWKSCAVPVWRVSVGVAALPLLGLLGLQVLAHKWNVSWADFALWPVLVRDLLLPIFVVSGAWLMWGQVRRSPWSLLTGWLVAHYGLFLVWIDHSSQIPWLEKGPTWWAFLPATVILIALGQGVWEWMGRRWKEDGPLFLVPRVLYLLVGAALLGVYFLSAAWGTAFDPRGGHFLPAQAGQWWVWVSWLGLVACFWLWLRSGEWKIGIFPLLFLLAMPVVAATGSWLLWTGGEGDWPGYGVLCAGFWLLAFVPLLVVSVRGQAATWWVRYGVVSMSDAQRALGAMTLVVLAMNGWWISEHVVNWWFVAGWGVLAAVAAGTSWRFRSNGWCGIFALWLQMVGFALWWKWSAPEGALYPFAWRQWWEIQVIVLSLTGVMCLLLERFRGVTPKIGFPWSVVALVTATTVWGVVRFYGLVEGFSGFSSSVAPLWMVGSWLAAVGLTLLQIKCGRAAVIGRLLAWIGIVLAYGLVVLTVDAFAVGWAQVLWGLCVGSGLISLGLGLVERRGNLMTAEARRILPVSVWAASFLSLIGVIVLVLWMDTRLWTGLNEEWTRFLAALALVMNAAALAALDRPQLPDFFRVSSWLLLGFAPVAAMWAWMPVETGVTERLTAWFGMQTATVALLGGVRLRNFSFAPDWLVGRRNAGVLLAGMSIAVGVVLLLVEGLFSPRGAEGEWTWMMVIPVAGFLGLAALGVVAALDRLPGFAPVPLGWREPLVYVAEGAMAAVFVHLRLTAPWLFGGLLAEYWPVIILALAFIGTACGHVFLRVGPPLPGPLLRTGLFLPLLPVLGFWVMESRMDFHGVLFLTGLFYGAFALVRRSWLLAAIGALAANLSLWFFLNRFEGFSFFQHPQMWLIPGALSVLVGVQWNKDRLSAATQAGVRYGCLLVIYVSSSADLFINGMEGSFWLPLILGALAVAGVLLGIALRIKAFLLLGAVFLLIDLLAVILHASANLGWTWIWYVVGLCAGVFLVVAFALFEKRREQTRAALDKFKKWED